MKKIFLAFCAALVLVACKSPSKNTQLPSPNIAQAKTVDLAYAKQFTLVKTADFSLITLVNPWQKGKVLAKYFLFTDSAVFNQYNLSEYTAIQIPVKRIVPLSTSFYGFINCLKEMESVVGIENANFVYSPYLNEKLKKNTLSELGQNGNLSVEKTLSLNPNLLMCSGAELLSPSLLSLQKAGVPIFQNLDWQELHPLGRAEWIKLFGELYGKTDEANAYFELEKSKYEHLVAQAKNLSPEGKTVVLGHNYQGTWYLPGGRSYVAQFLKDANCQYDRSNDTTTGSIALNYEIAFSSYQQSKYWLNPGGARSLSELASFDKRYKHLAAFQNKQVYNFTQRINEAGGNDYWESGGAQPSVVLHDLLAIFHPEKFAGQPLFYYTKLK